MAKKYLQTEVIIKISLFKFLLFEKAFLEGDLLLPEGLLALGLDLVLHHGEVLLLRLLFVRRARELIELGLLAAEFLSTLPTWRKIMPIRKKKFIVTQKLCFGSALVSMRNGGILGQCGSGCGSDLNPDLRF
jgi:hypothetical protein